MNLLEQVKNTLKWKKSNKYCAAKLGISLEKYKQLKRQADFKFGERIDALPPYNKVTEWKEDLEEGTAQVKGIAVCEPRTAEEIIDVLKIDTTKWKLSSYWNKETSNGWMISAMVTALKKEPKDILAEVIANFQPKYKPVESIILNTKFDKISAAVLSIQDLHFGKEGNNAVVDNFKTAIKDLIHRAYYSHRLSKIIYVIGGDLLNMDTWTGTTTSGTPVDNETNAYTAYKEAFDAMYWSVNYIKQFCEELHVVYLPGNHDRLSSYHLAHALSKCFNGKNIMFDVEYKERKVVMYGNNFFAFEHGDVSKKNTPLVYATEYPIEWGATKYRTCYTGHFHSKKTTEYISENEHNGFTIKHLPSLSSTDYWHYHNKFIGCKQQAIMEIHDASNGKIAEFSINL